MRLNHNNKIHLEDEIEMIIRGFKANDTEEMYNIALLSLKEYFTPEVFAQFNMQWPSGQLIACDFTGRVIGFLCSVKLFDGGCRVMMFAVHPNYRGRGIGTKLLHELNIIAKMQRIRYVTLEVRKDDPRARKFYELNGFMELETLNSYYNDGSDGVRMDHFIS